MDAFVATRRVPPPSARAATTCSVGVGPRGHHLRRRPSAQRAGSKQAPQRPPWPPAGRALHARGRCPWLAGASAKGRRKTKLCRRASSRRRPTRPPPPPPPTRSLLRGPRGHHLPRRPRAPSSTPCALFRVRAATTFAAGDPALPLRTALQPPPASAVRNRGERKTRWGRGERYLSLGVGRPPTA
jgi:hypothetical protein